MCLLYGHTNDTLIGYNSLIIRSNQLQIIDLNNNTRRIESKRVFFKELRETIIRLKRLIIFTELTRY